MSHPTVSQVVWKYKMPPETLFTLNMPAGAEILTVQAQGQWASLWALVDPNATPVPRWFVIAGFGHPIPIDQGGERIYVGTFQMDGGALVFHVFEMKDGAR